MPEINFSYICSPGFKLSKSNALSYSESGSLSDLKLPHSVLITIFPDFGSSPVHLGIALACSTYAAFVPVPNITAATTSLSIYLPPANVPTVSLTSAVTFISSPCLSMALLNSATTSSPTVPLIEKPFVHLMSVPDDIDNWFTGKEKVKPSSLCLPTGRWNSSPSVSINLANTEAMKSNSSKEVPTIRCGGIETS